MARTTFTLLQVVSDGGALQRNEISFTLQELCCSGCRRPAKDVDGHVRDEHDEGRWKEGCPGSSGASYRFDIPFSPPSIGVPAAQQIPCSGITEAIEPRLKSYFARSGASGGGSHSLKVFTEELFPGRKYKRLKPDEQEQVKLAQLHGQKFVKIDTQRAVFSKTCLKSIDAASVPRGTPFPSICNKCRDVLRDRQFRQALRRSVPLPENFRFNNKQYRNETAGHLFAKCSQLQEILNEVRTAIDSF
jgi:hypothetical protein